MRRLFHRKDQTEIGNTSSKHIFNKLNAQKSGEPEQDKEEYSELGSASIYSEEDAERILSLREETRDETDESTEYSEEDAAEASEKETVVHSAGSQKENRIEDTGNVSGDKAEKTSMKKAKQNTPEDAEEIIVLDHVSRIYHIGDEEVRALNEACLTIHKGEFVSIIGPSGSGKSTMMNIIGCLDQADEGKYFLNGQPIEDYSETELARIRNRQIGFIFQNFNLIGNLTAWENVELPLIYQRVPRAERKVRVEEALARVKLGHREHHKPSELSGGQQQRVAIARAIATQPTLFLADEPTGNLDSRTGDEIMTLFHELKDQGHTIVLITHDESVAVQAERSIRIRDGKVSEVEQEQNSEYDTREVVKAC